MEGFFSSAYGEFLAKQDNKRDDFIERPPWKIDCFGYFRQNKLRENFLPSKSLALVRFKTAFLYPQEGKISFRSELLRQKQLGGGSSSAQNSATKGRANSSFLGENADSAVHQSAVQVLNVNFLRVQTSIKNSLDLHLKLSDREPLSILLSARLPYFQNIKIYAKLKQNLTNSSRKKSARNKNHVKIGGFIANNKINANVRLTEQYTRRLFDARVNMTLAHTFYFGVITRINVSEGIFDKLSLLINFKKGPVDAFLENRNLDNLLTRCSVLSVFYEVRENLRTAVFIIMKSASSGNRSEGPGGKLHFFTAYNPSPNLELNLKLSSSPYVQAALNWKMNKYMEVGVSSTQLPAKLPQPFFPLRLNVKIKTY